MVLDVSEDTPIQAEFTMTYFESGKQQTVSITKPLRLYSRNAITWQDPQRIANFVTRKDPPVRDFVRGVSTLEFKNRKAAAVCPWPMRSKICQVFSVRLLPTRRSTSSAAILSLSPT